MERYITGNDVYSGDCLKLVNNIVFRTSCNDDSLVAIYGAKKGDFVECIKVKDSEKIIFLVEQ